MKNVLFIVYYFPPMGGSGVQRPLKFAKYLRDHGWNPIVLCPEPGAYHTFDESLQRELESLDLEIHRVDAKTPFHTLGGKKRKVQLSPWLENNLRKVSTFFWLPDNKKGWIQPAVRKADEIISGKKIDAIYTTANPYSNLIIGKQIKEKHSIPIIMDLRDEWLESHLIKYPTKWHRYRMHQIESDTLKSADVLTVINQAYKESFQDRHPDVNIRVLNQGFDPDDFDTSRIEENEPLKFKLMYSGLFYGERSPENFLRAVRLLVDEDPGLLKVLELHFQGGLSSEIIKLTETLKLNSLIVDHGYVDHKTAVKNLMEASALWLMIGHLQNSKLVTVGKMFEYFGTKKPILALVPEGNSRTLLDEYNASYYAHPMKVNEIAEVLKNLISDFRSSKLPIPDSKFVCKFDRSKITAELADLLNQLT